MTNSWLFEFFRRVGKAKRAHHGVADVDKWWARRKVRLCPPYDLNSTRSALGQNALQGAAAHVEATGGLRDGALAHLLAALDVLPACAVGRPPVCADVA